MADYTDHAYQDMLDKRSKRQAKEKETMRQNLLRVGFTVPQVTMLESYCNLRREHERENR